MTTYAYLRVSTKDKGQTTENQRKQIADAGFSVEQYVSEDGVSGSVKAFERAAFKRLMLMMQQGDTLIITMVDRLGRTASDILNTVEVFKERGIRLRVLQFDGIDITSSMGKMILTCMAAMAELERNILIERTVAGMSRAKEQGKRFGAPLTIAPEVLHKMCHKKLDGATLDSLVREFGIPRNTIHRNVTKWADKISEYTAQYQEQQSQLSLKSVVK